tara:strand:- start:230 stop:2467 length:2238 start_codon:yes stop_codon:yes gene_type:complete
MNQQQYPLEGIAEQLASQGRYGDTMLMHVNPAEVEGIASLVPGGQLPRNPMTGQPEAFIGMILGMLAKPLLTKGVAALGAKAGAGALGTALTGLAGSSAAMTGITSGLIETARTGDIKKGFTSGLMGAGIGKALGAATDAVDKGIGTAADQVSDLTKSVAGAEKTITDLSSVGKLTDAQKLGLADAERLRGNILGGKDFIGPPTADGLNQGSMRIAEDALRDARITAGSGMEGYKSLGDAFQPEGFKAATSAITKPEAFLPLALGASQRAEIDYQEAMDAEGRRMEEEKAAEEQYSRDLMERSFEQIRQDYPEMDNQYNPYAYAQGGIVSIDPTQYAQTLQGLSDVAGPIDMNAGGVVNMVEGGPASMIYNTSPSGAAKGGVGGSQGSPASRNRQAKIRGTTLVAPEAGYRPGFDAEHRFFQNIAKEGADPVTTPVPPKDVTIPSFPEDGVPRFAADPFMNAVVGDAMSGLSPQFLGMEGLEPSEFMDLQKSAEGLGRKGVRARKKLRDLQDKQSEEIKKAAEFESEMAGITAIGREDDFKGGVALDEPVRIQRQETEVTAPAAMMDESYLSGFNPRFRGSIGMQEGGITEVAAQEQMVEQPAPEDAQLGSLIEQTAMAVLGQVSEEEAEIIINRFIDEFGQEAFQMLREQVLQGVVPDAQTQGLVDGPGGGMDDQVQGMIGDQQRVAVSPGEFIVPADVVSGLGDGDTDAGADELDAMMDRVRVERTGTLEQPPRLSAGGLLPA